MVRDHRFLDTAILMRFCAIGAISTDFTHSSAIMVFNFSSRQLCIDVPITYDYICENNETFTVTLSEGPSLPPYVSLQPNTLTVKIHDILRMIIITCNTCRILSLTLNKSVL